MVTHYARALVVVLVAAASAGCASDYYGYSEAQWDQLSDAERQTARAEYQAIIDAKREADQNEHIEEDRARLIRRGLGMNPEHAPY